MWLLLFLVLLIGMQGSEKLYIKSAAMSHINEQQKWSDIVHKVENSNSNEVYEYQVRQHQRKQAYKNGLEKQIKQHKKSISSQQKDKQTDRSQVEQKIHNQLILEREKLQGKKRNEQNYKLDNLALMKKNAQGKIIHHRDKRNVQDSPLFKLIDRHQERRIRMKEKFRFQNHVNQLQTKIRNQNLYREKQQDRKLTEQFQNHVEFEYSIRQQTRKTFQHRYLKTNDQSRGGEKREYMEYLNNQVNLSKDKKIKEKDSVDGQLAMIMRSPQIANSSPAYLGRIPAEHDRKKQLDVLDRTLGLYQNKNQRTNTDINDARKSYASNSNDMHFRREKPENFSLSILPKLNKRSQNEIVQKQKFVTERAEHSQSGIPYQRPIRQTGMNSNPNLQKVHPSYSDAGTRQNPGSNKLKTDCSTSRPQSLGRSFMIYDLIAGKQKHFFV